MKRADIEGHELSQKTNPCGRLVKVDYDSARKIMTFDVPSGSRDIVWGCELECTTGQFACDCEQFRPFPRHGAWDKKQPYRNMVNGKCRDEDHGAFLEQIFDIHPLITRKPSGLCPHGKRVREFLKRRKTPDGQKLFDHIQNIVSAWEKDVVKKTA